VDVEHVAPVGERHLREALVAQDAGIVDEDVDLAEALGGFVDHRGDGGFVGDRGSDGVGGAAVARNLGGDGVGLVERLGDVVDDDVGAVGGEEVGVGAAEASSGAGDKRGAPGEIDRHG